MAISLVAGNTTVQNSKVNVMRILETARLQHEIPVYEGAKRPLVHDFVPTEHYMGLDGFHDAKFPDGGSILPDTSKVKPHAAAEIVKLVSDNPRGQIKLVALGPL